MTKRVGLYLRVSTKNGQTVNNQRQALTEAIGRRQGWIIADEFPDEGISGAKGRDKRPEFDRLLKEVVRGKIDVVAAWSVDRLDRSLPAQRALRMEGVPRSYRSGRSSDRAG
jgi:DNA invertase Pin-like site-specific DNA recombinase